MSATAVASGLPASAGDRNAQYADYNEAFERRLFAKETLAELEARMQDRALPNVQRVLAWITRTSRGNYSLYCVNSDGTAAFQADCARALNMDKSTVSRTMSFLEQRGHIERRGIAKVLYLPLDPVAAPDPVKLIDDPDFQSFLENWKVAAGVTLIKELEAAMQARKVADSVIRNVKKVAAIAYRESRLAQQNGAHIRNIDLEDSVDLKTAAAAAVSVTEEAPAPRQPTPPPPLPFPEPAALSPKPAKTPPAPESRSLPGTHSAPRSAETQSAPPETARAQADETQTIDAIRAALARYVPSGYAGADRDAARRLLAQCRRYAPSAPAEAICAAIEGKGPRAARADNPMGFLLKTVPPCFEGWTLSPAPAEDAPVEDAARARAFAGRIGDGSVESFRRTTGNAHATADDLIAACEAFDLEFPVQAAAKSASP